jgi:hypothetical protein
MVQQRRNRKINKLNECAVTMAENCFSKYPINPGMTNKFAFPSKFPKISQLISILY